MTGTLGASQKFKLTRLSLLNYKITLACGGESANVIMLYRICNHFNQHRHTKTCRKYGGHCRFNYPRPPAPHTIIVQPLVESDKEKRSKILLESDRTIGKVLQVLEEEESFENQC